MRRYRALSIDFDTRPRLLGMEIADSWEPAVKANWQATQSRVRASLQAELGVGNWPAKEADVVALGAAPFSIVSYHNRFLRDCRTAFVQGSYYAALTGACCLGERILNHMVMTLLPHYAVGKKHKPSSTWKFLVDTLVKWNALAPGVDGAFLRLKKLRNESVHFNVSLDTNLRSDALVAVQQISNIIDAQFGVLGTQPWFIPNARGVAFVSKVWETRPFIAAFYVPACVLVGADYELVPSASGFDVIDHSPVDPAVVTDEDFLRLFEEAQGRRVATLPQATKP